MPDPATDAAVGLSLQRMGLVPEGQSYDATPLTGGVSSQILLVESSGASFCFKQALSKLKVQAEWFAPVERSLTPVVYEVGDLVHFAAGEGPQARADSTDHAERVHAVPNDQFSGGHALLVEAKDLVPAEAGHDWHGGILHEPQGGPHEFAG